VNQDALDWLFSLAQFGIKFGLDNIRAIVESLGHPERQYRSVHIAGTNGKGSVAAIVELALRSAGHRTGRYTSPHLLDLSERFAIDGRPVERDLLIEAVTTVRDAVDHLRAHGRLDVHPTFFEVTTAAGFEIFRRSAVDIAVCEVGLGGRLDATNVLSPMVCGITSIAFDHEQYLGHTLAAIAVEKAGIIKPRTPVVVGRVPQEAGDAIRDAASSLNAPLIKAMDGVDVGPVTVLPDGSQRFTLRTPRRTYGEVHLALAGDHQVDNAVVAVRLIEQLESTGTAPGQDAIVSALATVRWPGRLERIVLPDGREALLDAAHNAAGATALAHHLERLREGRPLVFSAMRDKDAATMLAVLAPFVSRLIVTRASNPRAADPSALASIVAHVAPELPVEIEESPADALARAWSAGPRIVVAGSIFLLADAMKQLGRS
jgi:dihydrofolate synthase / folylpolyglutamate synthase